VENFMQLSTRRRALASLTVALFSTAALPALAAPDAAATAEALSALVQFGPEGSTLTYGNASATATDVILTDVKVTSAEDGSTLTVPQLVIVNPIPRPQGGFSADSMTFNAATMINEGEDADTVTVAEGSATGILVPSLAELEANPRFAPFNSMDLRGLEGSSEMAEFPLDIASMHVELANVVNGQPNDIKMIIDGIVIPVEAFEFEDMIAGALASMGYESFNAGVTIDGAYAEDTDTLTIRSVALRADDVGELSFTGIIGDFPIGNLLEGAEMAQNALTAATLHSASITFRNAGIIDRILEEQARPTGLPKEQFAMGFSMALPLMLNFIGNPEFQQKLAEPLGAFIVDPKNITITAAPGAPVPMMAIAGAAMGAYDTLPDLLALDVKANQ
jgi:hypothetical protein